MKKLRTGYLIGLAAILLIAVFSFTALGGLSQQLASALAGIDGASEAAVQQTAVLTGKTLGIISLIPALLTILLAFITKEVISSLVAGLFAGLIILQGVSGSGNLISQIGGVFNAFGDTIISITTDSFRGSIIILCLCIGGMVAVINVSGGFAALGKKITKGINSPRRATLMAQAMGMCLFFDDYANALITGPVMRGITDKQGVSREKLAYIVDSTAAPVAGIAIISSWIAAELSAIESGFVVAGIEASAYSHFFGSIPFCFYNFIAVAFVLYTAVMGREYGPMLLAERRARAGEPLRRGSASESAEPETGAVLAEGSIWSAVLPIITMCLYAFVGFYVNGMQNAVAAGLLPRGVAFSLSTLSTAFGNADTVGVLMRAAILSGFVAIFMGCVTKKLNLTRGIKAWVEGASGILLTVLVLVLAWGLSETIAKLGAAYFLVDLVTLHLPYWILPMLIFIVCCAISFAAGSFGCMVIVMPITVPVAYQAALSSGIGYEEQFIFACIAAVLSGAIFGDHCSPVTDTTILSSLGAGCDNLDHVKTQLPYALTVAGIASVFGYLPAGLGVPPIISIATGLFVGFLIVRFIGKKIEPSDVAKSGF
ncbi:MAG: Na+/H+ antiporter NhaC family protein [Oscillospiraceae bacterium]